MALIRSVMRRIFFFMLLFFSEEDGAVGGRLFGCT